MIGENLMVEERKEFKIKGFLDKTNRRIWLFECKVRDAGVMTGYLLEQAKNHGLQKVIIPARRECWLLLKKEGFHLEGKIKGFFNGEHAYTAVFYPDPARRVSPEASRQVEMLKEIKKSLPYRRFDLPEGYHVKSPSGEDMPKVARLYRETFATYPSPVDQPGYLEKIMGRDAIFKIIARGEEVVSAAGAEIDRENGNAEMTNCATRSRYRGMGLMRVLVNALETELGKMGIRCLYSLARAKSYGMNQVFYRMGYEYGGTLINNCHICGDYENMNIWSKF